MKHHDLISEARALEPDYGSNELIAIELANRLADALAALEAQQGNTEWGVRTLDGEYVPVGDERWAHDSAQRFGGSVVRRRPAGPWVVVSDDTETKGN